jgi:amino acid adenylation domain-containing protein
VQAPTPLFSSLLNYRHNQVAAVSAESMRVWEGVEPLFGQERTNYPLVLSVDDFGEDFSLTAQVSASLDPRRVCELMRFALTRLVDALRHAPLTPSRAIDVLPILERRQVIEGFNATATEYPGDKLVHVLFEEQVEQAPDAVAVIYEDQFLTYGELNKKANQLAHYLRNQGTKLGEFVPIIMPRCLDMVVAQLAILKAGCTYMPIDMELPEERQAFMIEDCGAKRVIASRPLLSNVSHLNVQWGEYIHIAKSIDRLPTSNLRLTGDSHAIAYVMYTSGSTGIPKGVMISHRAINRLVINNEYAPVEKDDCIAHCSSPAFDASTFEIWLALLNGARVLIVPKSTTLETMSFSQALIEHKVTMMFLTTTLFNQCVRATDNMFAHLKYVFFGGETADVDIVRRLLRKGSPRCLVNIYGPTECTTFAIFYKVDRVAETAKSIPIGRPISNTSVYILDLSMRPVPIGVTGELYIGGAGVARGYLNRPELTAERFLKDPFSQDAEARMYKTGDLGRWRADGNIEYLGRNDHQVKIRGFRIELGEIESCLSRAADVKEAAVIAREDVPGEKRLVAYLTKRDIAPSIEALRMHIKASLPEYMVPSAFVLLESLPLTSNGKLDRKALPVPELNAYAVKQYEAPQGEIEATLASIWQELLHVERVGRRDNFFELGGHSLLIAQLVSRIRNIFELEVPLANLFDNPSLMAMANCMVDQITKQFESDDLVSMLDEAVQIEQ